MNHVTVVGAGVIGLFIAQEIRVRGIDVTLLEAKQAGSAASAGNAGWIVPSLSGPVPAPGLISTSIKWLLQPNSPLSIRPRIERDFARWLFRFWRSCSPDAYQQGVEATARFGRQTFELLDRLLADIAPFEMHADGILFAFESEEAMEHDRQQFKDLHQYGYELPHPLLGSAVQDCEPILTRHTRAAYVVPQERVIRPERLIRALVQTVVESGVDLRVESPVDGMEISGNHVTAVRTSTGTIETDAVVIAAGAWTPNVASLAGVHIPIEAGKGYSLDYSPPPATIRRPIYLHEARLAITPFDGTTRVAGTMELGAFNDHLPPSRLRSMAQAASKALEGWPADPAVARAWSGLRPMTPDGLPVLGWVPGYANLAVASGHAMLGLTLAPVTAVEIADLLVTGNASEQIKPFDPARFRN